MKIAYGKIGRSFNLDRANMSTLGGDVDVLNELERLAHMFPNDEIVIVSRNTGEHPQAVGLPQNIVNVWHDADNVRQEMLRHKRVIDKMNVQREYTRPHFLNADAIVMWVGQHGTSNVPIPNVGTDWDDNVLTNPQDSFLNYVGFITLGINEWRDAVDGQREEAWLLPDVRNYFKGRDLKWPLREPMLAQYDKDHQAKFERWLDPRSPEELGFDAVWEHSVWVTTVQQRYAGVELAAITNPAVQSMPSLDGRVPFGMLINENAKDRKPTRLDVLTEWVVLPGIPMANVHGTWSERSLRMLGVDIQPLPHAEAMHAMGTWRSTFTTPASGSGWATAKPWEAFLMGTVCFFHPKYDEQDHILGQLQEDEKPLYDWLRVKTPDDLKKRVAAVASNDDTYLWLATTQRRFLERVFTQDTLGNTLRDRILQQSKVQMHD